MNPASWSRRRQVVASAALAALLGLVALHLVGNAGRHTITVEFTQAKGLYVGDDVVVLGIPIGEVEAIEPGPESVRVTLAYDSKYDVPADAKAILESPNLVTVRQVSLTPAYDGGPVLADGAEIPVSRTDIPVEWDEIKGQLNTLTTALGPKGANSKGALNRLLKATAANLDGQGTSINQTVTALSEAMLTIADNKGELFGTVRNLEVIITALARADREVADFNSSLATVSQVLASNRTDMAAALKGITRAFTDLDAFLKDNRSTLRKTIKDLEPTTSVLASNRQHLADLLQIAPHELSNLLGLYDGTTGSVSASLSLANVQAPGVLICSAIFNLGGTPDDCMQAIAPLAGLLTMDPPPIGVSPLESGNEYTQKVPGGTSKPQPSAPAPAASDPDLLNLLLGGLL